MHKRAENLLARAVEYRKYADYLESLLDQCQQDYHPHRSIDFRASRPIETDGLLGPSPDMFDNDFDFTSMGVEENDASSDSGNPTKEICIPTQSLKVHRREWMIHHYGNTAPFPFTIPRPRRKPDATYVLLTDGIPDDHYNPDFDWSRHLPDAVPLDRRSHDKALDLLFKFFTSWCLRVVPALFLRDMYRALSTPHYSPMLHNALVALGLAFLDEHRFRDLKARQYFANTAKSFIEAECRKPNLSVVHALSILASFHSSQGDQTLGYMYFGMSARMGQACKSSYFCFSWVKLGLMDETDMLDRRWANWTTFTQDVCWSLYVGRDFCVSTPTDAELSKDPPFVDPEFDQMPWATCELLMIARPIMDVVNGLNKSRSRPFAVDELISEIEGSLAPELEITVKSRPTATPHKLMLHLAYWWLFILLHRPSSIGRDLCRRAAENIMELLSTYRSLYSLRYCPITLIQAVFSAGTVYLLTAMQASSGIRIAQKELRHSLDQQKLVLQYLHEIGRSWQCATNIAGIMKNLMHEQLKPVLERKTIPIMSSSGGALQVPDYGNDDDDDAGSTLSRSSSKGHVRRRSSSSKIKQQRRVSTHSLHQDPSNYATSSSPARSAPIAIQTPPKRTPSFSSSPSSLPDPWGLRPNGTQASGSVSPSPSSSPIFTTNFLSSPSTSFAHRGSSFQGYPQPFTYAASTSDGPSFSGNGQGASHAFHGQGALFGLGQDFGTGQSPSHHYPGKELSGFLGMLGGQTLPQAPFVGPFGLGDTLRFDSSQSPFGTGFLAHSMSSTSLEGMSIIDNDTNMDDNTPWDQLWAQTF
ncbi:hypothetical protein BDZ97DRAFT_1829377, partial [Flammula alnicola]